jgi:hypothetical protein
MSFCLSIRRTLVLAALSLAALLFAIPRHAWAQG